MGNDSRVWKIGGTAAPIGGAVVLAFGPTAYPEYAIAFVWIGIVLITVGLLVSMLAHSFFLSKETHMSEKDSGPAGIALDNCGDIKIINCGGFGLSTFIRAKNSRDLNIHQNRTENTATFMDLDNVSGVNATNNIHNGLEQPTPDGDGVRLPISSGNQKYYTVRLPVAMEKACKSNKD